MDNNASSFKMNHPSNWRTVDIIPPGAEDGITCAPPGGGELRAFRSVQHGIAFLEIGFHPPEDEGCPECNRQGSGGHDADCARCRGSGVVPTWTRWPTYDEIQAAVTKLGKLGTMYLLPIGPRDYGQPDTPPGPRVMLLQPAALVRPGQRPRVGVIQ